MLGILFSGLLTGCGDVHLGGTDPIPECEFDEPVTFTMGDFGLTIPAYTSPAFNNAFNVGGIIYNLNTVLDAKGDYGFQSNKAKVTGKLVSDGENCKGTNSFSYSKGDSRVLANSIIVDAPSNTSFSGEVSVTIRTDDFMDVYSNNQAFYIRWRVAENDPDKFVNGNLTGEKVSYNPDFESIYIPRDELIYYDGRTQLISTEMAEPSTIQ